MDNEKLESLMNALLDGNISTDQQQALDKILQESEEARSFYHQYIDTHIALDWHFGANSFELPSGLEPLIEKSEPKKAKSNIIPFIVAIAATIVVVFIVMKQGKEDKNIAEVNPEKRTYSLRNSVSAVWSHEKPLNNGHQFKVEKLTIDSGYGELVTEKGVKLIIEGPAELELLSNKEVRLNKGKMVSHIPVNSDFTVSTPITTIKSSQEAALKVKENGDTEILALTGNINSDNYHIQETQSRLVTSSKIVEMKSDPRDFMRVLPENAKDIKHIQWSFDEGKGKVTHYKGDNLKDKDYDAYLKSTYKNGQGPKWVNGKFGQALYFNGQGNFLETGFPGVGGNNARTVAFWVKVPTDAQLHQSKLVSWGSYAGKGNTWQISWNWNKKDGQLGALRAGIYHGQIVGKRDLRDGQWHHISVVMFGGKKANVNTHILLYIDGKLEHVSKKSILGVKTDINSKKSIKVLMGRDAMSYVKKNKFDNVFKGWMDEVYIFNSALSESQIKDIMQENTPPRN
jgi:hypothetical protein